MDPLSEFPPAETTLQGRLRGSWLAAGRLLWILIYLLCLFLFLISLPVGYRSASALVSTSELAVPSSLMVAYLMAIDLVLFLGIATISGMLFWRRPDHRVVWILSLMIITYGTTLAFSVNALAAVQPTWYEVTRLLLSLGEGLALIGAYIFPDGRFVPKWTRWLALFLIFWITLAHVVPSIGPAAWPPLFQFLWRILWLASILLTQVYRFSQVSSPSQQQQTKWFVLGLIVIAAVSLAVFLFQFLAISLGGSLVNSALALLLLPAQKLAFLLVPITLSVSILRYRLWDVDFVINRSLVYGAMTVVLAALFVTTLLVVARLFEALSGSQQSVIAITFTALVFGAMFQPARRRLQRWVDSRIYGIQIDYRKKAGPKSGLPGPVAVTTLQSLGEMVLIGRGASSQVYRAQHPDLQRPVAVKILPQHLVDESEFRERFRREAQFIAVLKHPNIVQVYDFGEENGAFYMILEYVPGPTLHSYMEIETPLPLDQVISLARPLANAMDYAHLQGLVHRDIKPGNVLLDPRTTTVGDAGPFRPVLTDFGIAKLIEGQTSLTSSGGIVGTLTYMAPEQIQAAPDVDGRLDIYAFGVLVYEMLTGRPPFQSRNVGAVIMAHLNQPPPDPRQFVAHLPAGVVAPLMKALAKRPQDRFHSAGAFVEALQAAMT